MAGLAANAPALLRALRQDFVYDPKTGIFWRTRTTSSNARSGMVAGTIHARGYRNISVRGKYYRSSRLAWLWMTKQWPPAMVDHANGIRSDDRWANLRSATATDNAANAALRKDNSTGFKGVKPLRGRWQARIGSGGKQHLGTFDTAEEAHAAYQRAASERYGDFARAS